MIRGISEYRRGGPDDILMQEMMREKGLTEIPQFSPYTEKAKKFNVREVFEKWASYTPRRDGPHNPEKPEGDDPAHLTDLIRKKGLELGGSDIGFAELTPIMVNVGFEFELKYIVSVVVQEDYAKVLEGALEVEKEAYAVYVECARISTELAEYVRSLGFPAIASHNDTSDIQAIPALYAAGMGELGRNGSLLHPEFGAGWRPGFVITDAPVVPGKPNIFGVQKTCETCRICEQNCPPGAIRKPDDFVITEGIKRWQVDTRTCFEVSRFRVEYCHICVDVCPYHHKMNKDPERIAIYKAFLKKRKQAGFKTPAWFAEDEEKVLGQA